MTTELKLEFMKWAEKQIVRPPNTPLLFLFDNHSSNLQPELVQFAIDKKLFLYTFPANSTHLLQPCDLGFFGPLKKNFNDELIFFTRQAAKSKFKIRLEDLPALIDEAHSKTATPRQIKNCWKKYNFRTPTTSISSSTSSSALSILPTYKEASLTIRAQRKFGIELTSTDNLTNLQIIRKNQPVKRKEERYSVFQQQNNQYNQFNQMNIFNTRASVSISLF
jgi:hypothetical protein